MSRIPELKQRLQAIEAELKATEDQLPAHSVKPALMQRIFELEEEREEILRQLPQDPKPSETS